jgi:hypothetical protein
MRMWLLGDLENIIHDIVRQLREATEAGWHRTRPDHYRAILGALESALREGREMYASWVGSCADPGVTQQRLVGEMAPFAFRRPWRPMVSLIPVVRSRH